MGNSGGIIMFLTIIMTIVIGGFVYFYLQFLPQHKNQKNAVKCKNEWSTISFLIDDEYKTAIMSGEALDPKSITIFNETAISAKWSGKKKGTKFFLDRIAGTLQIETTFDYVEWNKEEFECGYVNIRF